MPFAVYIAFIVVADLLGRLGVQDLRWLYPVKIALIAALLMLYWRRYSELARWDVRPRDLLLAVAAGVLVLVLWINLDAGWMVVGSPAGFDPRDGERLNWLWIAVRIAGAALVVPVMEELFWRSWLLRWMAAPDFLRVAPAAVGVKAFVVSMVLFGVEHNQWLAGIVAGAVYAALYMRSGTLWTAIVSHAVTNGLLGAWIVITGAWTYW
nr:CAAX prenyl protease-related protein [Duganella radicis]